MTTAITLIKTVRKKIAIFLARPNIAVRDMAHVASELVWRVRCAHLFFVPLHGKGYEQLPPASAPLARRSNGNLASCC